MKTISLDEQAKYSNQYIALSQARTEVLASGKTIKEVEKELDSMKNTPAGEIIIEYVEPIDMYISPICL